MAAYEQAVSEAESGHSQLIEKVEHGFQLHFFRSLFSAGLLYPSPRVGGRPTLKSSVSLKPEVFYFYVPDKAR